MGKNTIGIILLIFFGLAIALAILSFSFLINAIPYYLVYGVTWMLNLIGILSLSTIIFAIVILIIVRGENK